MKQNDRGCADNFWIGSQRRDPPQTRQRAFFLLRCESMRFWDVWRRCWLDLLQHVAAVLVDGQKQDSKVSGKEPLYFSPAN